MRLSTSLNMIRQNRAKTQLCKVAEHSRRLCMVGARTHLFGQRNTSIPRKPRKRSRGPNRRKTRLLQSQGLLLKVELLVLIFLHLFHFKDEGISKKRILNASGLRYYSLKLKVFAWVESFTDLRILLNISAQISIANANQCFPQCQLKTKNVYSQLT